jgi:hypothetical protein
LFVAVRSCELFPFIQDAVVLKVFCWFKGGEGVSSSLDFKEQSVLVSNFSHNLFYFRLKFSID